MIEAKPFVETPISPGSPWNTPNSAPINIDVWVTDGLDVYVAQLCQAGDGLWGWRDDRNFSFFRHRHVLGWMYMNKPKAPNWNPLYIEPPWYNTAVQWSAYGRAREAADKGDGSLFSLSLHDSVPGYNAVDEIADGGYDRLPVKAVQRVVRVGEVDVHVYATPDALQFGPFTHTLKVTHAALWRRKPDEVKERVIGWTEFSQPMHFHHGGICTVNPGCRFVDVGQRVNNANGRD